MVHSEFPLMLTRSVNIDDIKKELDKYSVHHSFVHCFSTDVVGFLNISTSTLGAVVVALSPVLIAWVNGRSKRSIKIRLQNSTTVEAKGMTPQKLAKHLEVAVQATLSECSSDNNAPDFIK